MTRTACIATRFDAADGYEQAARVQRIAAMELARRIGHQYAGGEPARILEIGCGTGLLTRELRRLFPHAHITATDIAPRMLARLARHMPDDDGLSLHVMDGEAPNLPGPVDLICSSLAMQWFGKRGSTLHARAALLAPGGRMALTTLAAGSLAQWRAAYDRTGVACPTPHYPMPATLQGEWPAGGTGLWQVAEIIDTPVTPLAFMRELRAIGATHTGHPPATAGQMRRVLAAADANPFVISYQVAYGSFQRAAWPGVFVTGTDTDVGKTVAAAALVRAWGAAYWLSLIHI